MIDFEQTKRQYLTGAEVLAKAMPKALDTYAAMVLAGRMEQHPMPRGCRRLGSWCARRAGR